MTQTEMEALGFTLDGEAPSSYFIRIDKDIVFSILLDKAEDMVHPINVLTILIRSIKEKAFNKGVEHKLNQFKTVLGLKQNIRTSNCYICNEEIPYAPGFKEPRCNDCLFH